MIINRKKVLSTVLLIILFGMFFYYTILDEKRIHAKYKEYDKVEINDTFFQAILEIEIVRGGAILLILSDSNKVWIPYSRNYLYTPPGLTDKIKLNDTLIKEKGSDTIKIRSLARDYYFVLGRHINEKPKSE